MEETSPIPTLITDKIKKDVAEYKVNISNYDIKPHFQALWTP
jgi:hypothetical protein